MQVCENHGLGILMFWVSIVGKLDPISGTMDKYLFPSGYNLIGEHLDFQQDNAPSHKAKVITKF